MDVRVPYTDFGKMHDPLRGQLDAAWKRVMDREWFIGGEEDEAFEREFAAYCGAKAVRRSAAARSIQAVFVSRKRRTWSGETPAGTLTAKALRFSSTRRVMRTAPLRRFRITV